MVLQISVSVYIICFDLCFTILKCSVEELEIFQLMSVMGTFVIWASVLSQIINDPKDLFI